MSIIKAEFPILEHDTRQEAVIMPTHENLEIQLPKKAVFPFLGERVEAYAKNKNGKKVAEFISSTKIYPIYIIKNDGEEICLCQAPVGSAASVQILDWLIGYGVEIVISAGSCGTLVDFPENVFLIPQKALRDEGASYHYLPPSRFVESDEKIREYIERCLTKRGLPYVECVTWTTDGFYRETKEMIDYRKEEGCTVVEMECASLIACAKFRKIAFGQLLFTADSLANVDNYQERGWGMDSHSVALELCFDIIKEIR